MIFRSTTARASLFCIALGLGAAPAMPVCAQQNAMATTTKTSPPNLPQRVKKFIYLGWVTPDFAYLRDHTAEVEKQPFDGLMLTLPDGAGDVFQVQKWDAADSEKQTKPTADALKAVRWKKFDSNFLAMHAASDMDWFSDSDWEKVTQRAGWMARLAHETGAQLMWDSEPYGDNPWTYKL